MSDHPGAMLAGRYRLLGPLGRGGMGVVWRARDTGLDRLVAIKELRLPEHLGEEERRVWYARTDREARAAARLRHPGIVTVHERVVGEDGRPWIVMELIQGGSLRDLLRREGRLPVRRVAGVGRQILDALTAAHARGIVHRDVKPANVLLEGDRVVLTDFGIAALDGDATLTRSGALLGTPAYMSPEQVRGGRAGPESDLWSLGATLYAAVEGRPPFSGRTHGAVFVAIATEDPAPPVHAGPLTEVLTGLLRKDPAKRPTARAVRRLLADAAPAGSEPSAPPRTSAERPESSGSGRGSTGRAEPARSAGRGASSGAGRGSAGRPESSGSGRGSAARAEPSAPGRVSPPGRASAARGAQVARGARSSSVWRAAAGATPGRPPVDPGERRARRNRSVALAAALLFAGTAVSAAGWAALSSGTGHADRSPRHSPRPVAPATAAAPRDLTLTGHDGGVWDLAFSPDGRTLASASEDGSVRLWDVATGRQTATLLADPGRGKLHVAFSPDGRTLVSDGVRPGELRLWDVATRRLTGTLTVPSGAGVDSIAFSPDGKNLAVGADVAPTISDPGVRMVQLWDVPRRRVTATISGLKADALSVAFSPDGGTLAYDDRSVVRLWDVAARRVTATLSAGDRFVQSLAFSPDGKTLAGDGDHVIHLWDVATRRDELTLTGGEGGRLAFSPDGRGLAARGADDTSVVRLWDVTTGHATAAFAGHAEAVYPVAFSPDGHTLAAGSSDRTIRLWRIR